MVSGVDFLRPLDYLPIVCRWESAMKKEPPDLLPGTLDMLILRVLARDAMHGYGIAQRLRELSNEVLVVGESSLYPALQRLLLHEYVRAEWGPSENNRRARFYTLTPAGRKHLLAQRSEFRRLIGAIQHVLETA
jgi:PadR family transcriptional regulator PadR